MFRTVTPIFSIILAIVIFFAFTNGEFSDIRAKQAEIDAYDKAIGRAQAFNTKLESYLSIKRSMSELESKRLKAVAPPSVDSVRTLVDLVDLARKHNMLLGNTKIDEITGMVSPTEGVASNNVSAADFATTDVSFSLIGTYDQFRELLADMEKSLWIMEIVNLTFEASEGQLMQFDMTVRLSALTSPSV